MICIGDLVKCRHLGQKVGLVLEKKISNEGLSDSEHAKHLLGIYPQVFYVFFSGLGRTGPYHENELLLQQKCHSISSIDS
jgi:hypothetical protein